MAKAKTAQQRLAGRLRWRATNLRKVAGELDALAVEIEGLSQKLETRERQRTNLRPDGGKQTKRVTLKAAGIVASTGKRTDQPLPSGGKRLEENLHNDGIVPSTGT